MIISLTEQEVKYALLVHIFSKTGMRLQTEDCDIHFIKDDCSTRVDKVSILLIKE